MKRNTIFLMLGILCLLITTGCIKIQFGAGVSQIKPVIPGAPLVTTDSIHLGEPTTGICYSTVTSAGDSPLISRGVCWGLNPNPVPVDYAANSSANSIGWYSEALLNLFPSTTYYIRAYASNSIGTGYGNQITFTTSNYFPVITSFSPTSDTLNGLVIIKGNNLGSYAYSSTIGGVSAEVAYIGGGDTLIGVKVPANCTGEIRITNNWGTTTSQGSFTFIP